MQNLGFVEKVVKRTIGGILYNKITQNLADFSGTRDFLRNKMLRCILVPDFFSGLLCAVPVYLQQIKCKL